MLLQISTLKFWINLEPLDYFRLIGTARGGRSVRIAIDDFGKSYSSLSRLTSMPIQKLKIDMAFTAGMEREENIKIISGILALAQSLRLEVTAEGVENRFQQDTLIQLGCQQAQGYFYAKPLSLQELIALPDRLVPA